ncbi:hypothetical protein WA158_003851 [Blastocystis sp. Blastoise]
MSYRNGLDKAWYTFKNTGLIQKVYKWMIFHPNPIMRTRVVPEGVTAEGFRYPAPGSQPLAVIPTTESTDGLYDINHFKRDVTRFPREYHVVLSDNLKAPANIKETLTSVTKLSDEFKVNFIPEDKKVNGEALRDYRTIKTEDWELYVTQQLPTHLPSAYWTAHADEIMSEYESKNLPPVPGKMRVWNVPRKVYEGMW